MANMGRDDFYEGDEPVEKIVQAFESGPGPSGVTTRPSSGATWYLDLSGVTEPETYQEPDTEPHGRPQVLRTA